MRSSGQFALHPSAASSERKQWKLICRLTTACSKASACSGRWQPFWRPTALIGSCKTDLASSTTKLPLALLPLPPMPCRRPPPGRPCPSPVLQSACRCRSAAQQRLTSWCGSSTRRWHALPTWRWQWQPSRCAGALTCALSQVALRSKQTLNPSKRGGGPWPGAEACHRAAGVHCSPCSSRLPCQTGTAGGRAGLLRWARGMPPCACRPRLLGFENEAPAPFRARPRRPSPQ